LAGSRSRAGPAGGSDLLNALTGQRIGSHRVTASADLAQCGASDQRFRVREDCWRRGAFATRIAWRVGRRQPPSQRFQLIVADADGENPKIVLASRLPIMSPSWSTDGQWLVRVFESGYSAIYVQLRSGERRRVGARRCQRCAGLAPGDRRTALTLSGSGGNLDIYVLTCRQALTRITDDPSIDTEPV
jgi:TolB protein